MQIHVQSKENFEITPAIHKHITEKFSKLIKIFSIPNIHVYLSVENHRRHIAKATTQLQNKEIFAQADSEDMYRTINDLVPKLKHELERHKDHLQERD